MVDDLLLWPDRQQRIEKQHWRQTLELLDEAIADAGSAMAIVHPHVAIATPIAGLAEALGVRRGLRLGVIDHTTAGGLASRQESQHVVAVTAPEVLPVPQRMGLFRRCVRATRAAGHLILVANVVGPGARHADGRPVRTPTCSSLLEQLEAASGQGLQVLDLRSVRWGDEPVRRGVVLTMTRISVPMGW